MTFYEFYKDFFEGTEDMIDISNASATGVDAPKEIESQDIWDILKIFRNEEIALKWVKENYLHYLERVKKELLDDDGICAVTASLYEDARISKTLYCITKLKNGSFVLWESY